MKKLLFLFFLVCNMCIYAQSAKIKIIKLPFPSYPKKQTPKGINTYSAYLGNIQNAVLPFTEQELKGTLNFQDFIVENDRNKTPNLLFTVSGIKVDDLDIDIARSKANETYSVSIIPKEEAKISLITMVNGASTHYTTFPIYPKRDDAQKQIPTKVDFSFEEEEKYLIFNGDDKAKGTPYLVQEFFKAHLEEDYLSKVIVSTLYKEYDLRTTDVNGNFYYIKNKKNKALQEETKANIVSLEKVAANFKTLNELRAGKDQLVPFIDFWKKQLSNYDLSDKTGKKIGWGILMNLHKIYLLTEDYNSAGDYMNQMLALEEKKWITKSARNNFNRKKEQYAVNFNTTTGERIYGSPYEVDAIIQKIEKAEAIENNNITKATGYIIDAEGQKLEGKISMRFSPEQQEGSIISLDGDTTGKRATVTYINEKGKTKNKVFKCKQVKEIFVDGRVFESVTPKKSILDTSDNALGLSLNNTFFMERIFNSDTIKLFKDLTSTGNYYFITKGAQKAYKADSDVFAGCSSLMQRIKNGEFSNTDEDQIKIATTYSNECK